jgi:hypothetical protein
MLFLIAGAAWTCDLKPVEEARINLRLAANEPDITKAKEQARQARTSLERCATAAISCGCVVAAEDFLTAAAQADGATNRERFGGFISALHRANRIFSDAETKYRACAARGGT